MGVLVFRVAIVMAPEIRVSISIAAIGPQITMDLRRTALASDRRAPTRGEHRALAMLAQRCWCWHEVCRAASGAGWAAWHRAGRRRAETTGGRAGAGWSAAVRQSGRQNRGERAVDQAGPSDVARAPVPLGARLAGLLALCHPLPAALTVLATLVFAVIAARGAPAAGPLALLFASVALSQVTIASLNDY